VIKLGGVFLGPACQFDPSSGSAALVELCRPWFDYVLDRFGPKRCMFESNFPVDGTHLPYKILWNAFKRYAAPFSAQERHALFVGTADRTSPRTGVELRHGTIEMTAGCFSLIFCTY